MIEVNGFDVVDISVDVPADTIITKAHRFGSDIIGISGLLTLVFDPMKGLVDKLVEDVVCETNSRSLWAGPRSTKRSTNT